MVVVSLSFLTQLVARVGGSRKMGAIAHRGPNARVGNIHFSLAGAVRRHVLNHFLVVEEEKRLS